MDPEWLDDFFDDPATRDRFTAPEQIAFVESLQALGIYQSRVYVEDLNIFDHAALRDLIVTFIHAAPGKELPLIAISVVHYVGRDDPARDLSELRRELEFHRKAMTHFATDYNIEVALHVYAQGLDAAEAKALAQAVDSDAVDRLGIYFDFEAWGKEAADSLRPVLAELCAHPAFRQDKIILGNFPFCLYPPGATKLRYREAVGPLRGQIGSQRDLVKAQRLKKDKAHASCAGCRCRAACYTFTGIGEVPECPDAVAPETRSSLVFAGGSITRAEVPEDPDLDWAGPAEQGDLVAAVLDGYKTILIIDGYFYDRFPCTTFEVMLALEQGINVYGASSIGALRALELEDYGMEGCGYVLERLRKSYPVPYHLVAQTYDDCDRPITVPLVQIGYFLEQAEAAEVIDSDESEAAFADAESLHFTELTYATWLGRTAKGKKLRRFHEAHDEVFFDIKKQDALALLKGYAVWRETSPDGLVRQAYEDRVEDRLGKMFDKYPREPTFTLPADWRSEERGLSAVGRDARSVSAEETLERLNWFFDIDLVVADTSGYDPANQHILSPIFVPFYYVDYYPASATGNGEDRDEALVSAYMELVERIPASGLHIRQEKDPGWREPRFPEADLPQLYNWGMRDEIKQHAKATHGLARVSDLVAGQDVVVPRFVTMFAYSGSDGFAAGNTREEAVLYGLYEVIERDACQMHVSDPDLRARLPEFQVGAESIDDEDFGLLMRLFEEKGCQVAVFLLPTLYGLPCVMCEVYDRNQGVQRHGGIAVRSDLRSAARSALREAYMQYVTYFVGTRDDYRPFAPMKQARVKYRNAQATLFKRSARNLASRPPVTFPSIGAELDAVLAALTGEDIEHILVADLSPNESFKLSSVKVIVPRMDLWFCPVFRPSPVFAERAAQLKQKMAQK